MFGARLLEATTRRRAWLKAALALVVLGCLAQRGLEAKKQEAKKQLDAAEILRRAEEVRNPELDYAVDFTIRTVSPGGRAAERTASYTMLAHGREGSMILRFTPKILHGSVVLMSEGSYWMLLPRAVKPLQLAEVQVLHGEVSSGDIARSNIAANYDPALAGEEQFAGEPCYKLELDRLNPGTHYSRIFYWISKKDLFPKRLEYYGLTGQLLKMTRYEEFEKGPLGVRPMLLEIESGRAWEDRNSLRFSNLRRLKADAVSFTPEGMIPFRDAAMARHKVDGGEEVRLEDILRDLAASKKP